MSNTPLALADPFDTTWASEPTHQSIAAAAQAARQRLAARYATRAATLLRELFPTGARAIFERNRNDGIIGCSLHLVYDETGQAIWYSQPFADHPDAQAARNTHKLPTPPDIHTDTHETIAELVADAEEEGPCYLPRADNVRWPHTVPSVYRCSLITLDLAKDAYDDRTQSSITLHP